MPVGVSLIKYSPKGPPIAITTCSIVTDPEKFIRHTLGELDARLHHALQIKAGDSVFEILSKLGDCGLELRLEWPPASAIIEESPGKAPPKPTKPPDEDVPA